MGNQTILQTVKVRMGLSDELDPILISYVEEIGQRIKHYCNISNVPDALNFTWASMVMDALKVELSYVDDIADITDETVSLSIGDTSTNPAKKDGVTSTSKPIIEDIVLNYKVDLNRYRKLRW